MNSFQRVAVVAVSACMVLTCASCDVDVERSDVTLIGDSVGEQIVQAGFGGMLAGNGLILEPSVVWGRKLDGETYLNPSDAWRPEAQALAPSGFVLLELGINDTPEVASHPQAEWFNIWIVKYTVALDWLLSLGFECAVLFRADGRPFPLFPGSAEASLEQADAVRFLADTRDRVVLFDWVPAETSDGMHLTEDGAADAAASLAAFVSGIKSSSC